MDNKLVERVNLIDKKILAVCANRFFVSMTNQTLDYIDNVYNFLVHYCKYDTTSERLIKQSAVDGKFDSELFKKLLNLDDSQEEKLDVIINLTASRLKILLGDVDKIPRQLEYIVTEVSISRFNKKQIIYIKRVVFFRSTADAQLLKICAYTNFKTLFH